ncbi:hypothetical protein [Agarivorans gilvus]|uniref:Uncharacterized protein n=1 Tax=Agarivorans gilvus TaxID=680279 RepID=A0ABQ1I915_9ALTE|nr:hypothetical protein [Agarivorans gilvus]GGB22093.1 hypothetical protein GCM10007414_39360 [Agarivorans gilvus]
MRSEVVEDELIGKIDSYFKEAVRDFVVTDSSDMPILQLNIEMSLYNYFVVRATIEKGMMFFSIVQSGFLFKLFKLELTEKNLELVPKMLDEEVRLRIPDKYLSAKNW